MTHYVPFFTTVRQRLHTAVCGAVVYMPAHSIEPTCQKCAAWLAAEEAEAAALLKQWDEEDAAKRAALKEATRG